MEKPPELFDRDAEWTDLVAFAQQRGPGIRLALVRGRRRQGKSFLLRRLTEARDVGDTMAAGSEHAIAARLRRYRDAGVTDLAARPIGLGDSPEERVASRARTQQFLATLAPELA